MDRAVRQVVEEQVKAGIDIGNDGEQQRVGFQTYVPQRMSGFAGESKRRRGRDYEEYPELLDDLMRRFPKRSRMQNAPEAQAELHYLDVAPIRTEIARLKTAVAAAPGFTDCFLTAPSPGIISTTMFNAHYESHEAYLNALAREMSNEYRAVYDAGFILQIDSPDLAMDRAMFYRDASDAEFVKAAEMHVAALNNGLAGIPRERVRLHCCWGNWEGPHLHDVALATILPVLYQANVGALSIEFANPRHQHEYEAVRHNRPPAHMVLVPGVIDSTTNIVEHAEVVARRVAEAVVAVGDRERVIAGGDCGFGTFTGREWVIEPVVWLKFRSLREGCDIASSRL
jgi:5-methyltetrahydropteroyltriglutamate--homocysteine methyltransferase